MPRTQKGSNRSSNQGPGKANGKKQPKDQKTNGGGKRQDAPLAKKSLGNGMAAPKRSMNRDGSTTIHFEEFVQDISGSVAFSAASFPVQPGVPTLFAWLSTQAVSYQEYEVESMAFRFESAREATAPGKLMLAFQPDPSDALPGGKQEMLENKMKAKCKTWEECTLQISQADLRQVALGNRRFIRSGTLAANLDIKLFDLGQLIVASQGQADSNGIGELYVRYSIRLMTPVVSSAAQAIAASAQIVGATSISTSAVFGTAATVTGGLDLSASSNTLTFRRVGKYLVTMNVTGTGLDTSFTPAFSASTATAVLLSGISNAAADAGTNAICYLAVEVKARGQTVVFDFSGEATTITASTTYVGQWAVN